MFDYAYYKANEKGQKFLDKVYIDFQNDSIRKERIREMKEE